MRGNLHTQTLVDLEQKAPALVADIAMHPADADLSQDPVARRLGISPRYIRVLFNDEETSFTDFVLGQRLSRAHRLLLDPGHADRTVLAIAHVLPQRADVGVSPKRRRKQRLK